MAAGHGAGGAVNPPGSTPLVSPRRRIPTQGNKQQGRSRMSRAFIVMLLIASSAAVASAQQDPHNVRYNLANQHTYFLSPWGVTWQSAQAYSRTYGGYLASINNA